jgi:lipopolysaccharide export system protein LptA
MAEKKRTLARITRKFWTAKSDSQRSKTAQKTFEPKGQRIGPSGCKPHHSTHHNALNNNVFLLKPLLPRCPAARSFGVWRLAFLLAFLGGQASGFSQNKPATNAPPAAQDTQKMKIETALVIEYFLKNGREIQKLSGNVRLRQEDILVYCDTAIIDSDDAILKGSVVMEQGDSVKVFSDSTHYRADTKIADLFGEVVLVNGRQQLFTKRLRYDLGNKIATYHTGATMTNGKSQLKSRHGYYFVNQKEVFFKGDVLATDPEFTMRTDTMVFNTETQVVRFVAPTLISQRGSKIYTEGGFYDIENNFAEFDLNPQYEREGQRGQARKMRYEGTLKTYTLEGDAYIDDPTKGQQTEADVIRYNTDTEQTMLRGNAHFQDSTRDISGAEIRYDSRQKTYQLVGRGRVSEPPNIIEADSLNFNDLLGGGLALGDVVWQDTASDYTVLAWRMDYNKTSEYLHAFGGFGSGAGGRPMMKSLVDRDTLYMAADTLTSFKPDSASDVRLLLAHRDVRIFKSDLQAVCDSLTFSSADSIFWFYKIQNLPLIWSDTSQFSGDTIRMLLKNSKLDRIWLRQNALVVNSEDGLLFNQIKGRNTTAFFRDDEVREMLVEGNAQAIYYALDDSRAYIGLNETACSEMRLYFGDNQVEGIKFYQEPTGKFVPMKKAGKEQKKLDGFFWERTRRPRSVEGL